MEAQAFVAQTNRNVCSLLNSLRVGEPPAFTRDQETVVGLRLSLGGPHSLSNLGRDGATGCVGMGRHIARPRIATHEATRPTCPFAERKDEQRRGAVRAAGANGDAARL